MKIFKCDDMYLYFFRNSDYDKFILKYENNCVNKIIDKYRRLFNVKINYYYGVLLLYSYVSKEYFRVRVNDTLLTKKDLENLHRILVMKNE